MYDSFQIEQYDLLYRLDEWNTHRVSQNIFIDYRSWSNLFHTLSLFFHQSNLNRDEILFLSPVQIEAVEINRSGLWGESFFEYIYESYSVDPDFDEVVGKRFDFSNLHKVREQLLFRTENQKRPKLVVILHAELISPRELRDCNEYLHMQTVVCFDSAMFFDQHSIVHSVHKPLQHVFLHEEASPIQSFLYQCLEKKLIPISKENEVKVYEYSQRRISWDKMPKPIVSITEDAPPPTLYTGSMKGSLIYMNEPKWNYSLEKNKYFLNKGIYLVVDAVSRRDGVTRMSMHPTYTKYQFKVVPDVNFTRVTSPHFIDNLPQWKFKMGSILTPKTIPNLMDGIRLYNAVNLFEDRVSFYIL